MPEKSEEIIEHQVTSLSKTVFSYFPPFSLSLSPNLPAVIVAPRDCSDYNVLEARKNGVYRVTPDPRNGTFEVFCDMESFGGGWTMIQQRLDGSVSFNRTWAEYKKGFGNLRYWAWLSLLHFFYNIQYVNWRKVASVDRFPKTVGCIQVVFLGLKGRSTNQEVVGLQVFYKVD